MLQRFKVVIESEIEGGYSVHLPAIPGCASQGESIKEALLNIKEALEVFIESLREDNLPIPKSDAEVVVKDVEVNV